MQYSKASFLFMTTHVQERKIRSVGVDHISKTRADAKKQCYFRNQQPQIYFKTSPISEAPNCVLTSVMPE